LIILPKASLQNAQLLAERLRTEISNTEFVNANILVKLTISTGIAHTSQADTMDTLLKKADDALYVAKATKNAVMVAK
jgi:diguanylate cyclase (GGDEF)-like protein